MKASASSLLRRLEDLRNDYGGPAAEAKLDLLRRLDRRRLARAEDVLRLHEVLCFMHAHPDDEAVLDGVERALGRFASRTDLRRHREALADTGIAGTPIHYSFYWPTARWLVRRCPGSLKVDWSEFENGEKLVGLLGVLLPYCETPAIDMLDYSAREWIEKLKGPRETDAAFLIRRFEGMRSDSFGRERIYESLDIPVRIEPGRRTPTRTGAKLAGAPVVFQTRSLSRSRPDLRREVKGPPVRVRALPPGEGRRLIDMATEAMVSRDRDLDAFAFGDRNDVRLVDCGDGLQFVCIGAVPERRLLLESVYGLLTLKNGVPCGYVLISSLFGSSEIAYNVFETFRGAEAARTFGRVLAVAHHLFGARAFSIDPYQLGHDNTEGLESGAWWFYYKLGFRPEDPDVRRVLRAELRRMKRNPRHRSGVDTLQELSAEHMFLYLGRPRADVLGKCALGNVGLRISRAMAERFGSDREKAVRTLSGETADLLGVRSFRSFSSGERMAWERWAPLVAILPGVERWTPGEKRALVRTVRAKGGRRESEFVERFDGHARLRKAIWRLARDVRP